MTIEDALAYVERLQSELATAAPDAAFTLTADQLKAVIWVSEQRGMQREQEAAARDAEHEDGR